MPLNHYLRAFFFESYTDFLLNRMFQIFKKIINSLIMKKNKIMYIRILLTIFSKNLNLTYETKITIAL